MQRRLLILDDDPWALEIAKHYVKKEIPDLEITTRTVPDLHGDFDAYVIDWDFAGATLGAELARDIRSTCGKALIVAWSARLEREALKDLLNAGCDLAFDKNNTDECRAMARAIRDQLAKTRRSEKRSRFANTLRGLLSLVKELNRDRSAGRIS